MEPTKHFPSESRDVIHSCCSCAAQDKRQQRNDSPERLLTTRREALSLCAASQSNLLRSVNACQCDQRGECVMTDRCRLRKQVPADHPLQQALRLAARLRTAMVSRQGHKHALHSAFRTSWQNPGCGCFGDRSI